MNANAERRFVSLRRRLDQLGYRQPLAIESLPLVDKLFSDLVHTTESLRNAKLVAGKTEKESRNLDVLLEPYKAENAKLVRGNNEMHLELLKLKEDQEKVVKDLKAHLRKLDHEASDLKFLNNQYVHKVRCLEKDSKAKAERIQQLQEKNLQAVVQTPGGRKRGIPFRRQRMQIDELVPVSATSSYPVSQPEDPYVADLLLLADGRIQELQEDIIKVRLDLENAEGCIQHLTSQVEGRDKEIERLTRSLQGGRPQDVISLEAQNTSNEKLIAHLNIQVEYLQEANGALQQKMEALQQRKQVASSEAADLSLKNKELCQELTHIDHLAKQLEMDKERVLRTADVELQEAKTEIERQQNTIEELEEIITKLRREQSDGDGEKEQLQNQLQELREQNVKMESMMNLLEEEKSAFQYKVQKLMGAEKELVLELEDMRAQHGVCRRERSPSRLDAFVRSLEEERDHYRREVERYRRTRGHGSPAHSPGRGGSPAHSPGRGRGSTHSPGRGRGRSPRARAGRVREGEEEEEEELPAVMRERERLREALRDSEKHVEQIQHKVKVLSAERERLKAQCAQAQDDLRATRRSDAMEDVSRMKAELERAELRLQQMGEERDALLGRLKATQTSSYTDRQEEEKRIQELENNVKTLRRERLDLHSQVCVLMEGKESMEAELRARSAAMAQSADEAAQQRAEASALRLLQEQMEQSLSDTQQRLSLKMDELRAAHQQIQKLEEQIGELGQHGQVAAQLQSAIATLDREKDALQDEVDQKTERLAELQQGLSLKEKTLEDLRLTITNMETSLAQLQGALSSRERELSSLRRQLEASQGELQGLRRDKETTLRENRRLREDLGTMTRENQAVHMELEEALREKDEQKMRVHAYISEVSRTEKLMASKEQENRDLLERFRVAGLEMEDQVERLKQAEGLNSSIRLELLSSDSERRSLRNTISQQEKEIQQHVAAMKAFETRVSVMARTMSRLEEELRATQEQRATAQADLVSVRELCVQLDSAKEVAARQLTSRSLDLERVTGELEDVRSEAELLKKQLASERLTVRNLETLLSTNRHKELQSHVTSSEKDAELKLLRDRLTLADGKMAEQAREVSQLRGKLSQLQTELDVLKRQLTTERFERERTLQEMRRHGVSLSSLRSSSSSGSHLASPERSILRGLERSGDKSSDRNVTFKE